MCTVWPEGSQTSLSCALWYQWPLLELSGVSGARSLDWNQCCHLDKRQCIKPALSTFNPLWVQTSLSRPANHPAMHCFLSFLLFPRNHLIAVVIYVVTTTINTRPPSPPPLVLFFLSVYPFFCSHSASHSDAGFVVKLSWLPRVQSHSWTFHNDEVMHCAPDAFLALFAHRWCTLLQSAPASQPLEKALNCTERSDYEIDLHYIMTASQDDRKMWLSSILRKEELTHYVHGFVPSMRVCTYTCLQ